MIEFRKKLHQIEVVPMRFKEWQGEKPADSYGGKAFLDYDDVPVFAEIAVVKMLVEQGFDGAVWVDSYRKCFRNSMPPSKCEIPGHVRLIYDQIVSINGRRGGCWDVMAWNSKGVFFVECKRKGQDRMTEKGVRWFEAAQRAGLPADHFVVYEWEPEPCSDGRLTSVAVPWTQCNVDGQLRQNRRSQVKRFTGGVPMRPLEQSKEL